VEDDVLLKSVLLDDGFEAQTVGFAARAQLIGVRGRIARLNHVGELRHNIRRALSTCSIPLFGDNAPRAKIDLIPHLASPVTGRRPDHYRPMAWVEKSLPGRRPAVVAEKGIEHVLNALRGLCGEVPRRGLHRARRHAPHELRTPRRNLPVWPPKPSSRRNRLEKNVIFHNRFVELKELTEFIGAADLLITPYLDEAQSRRGHWLTSFGAGKAVISIPIGAAELLCGTSVAC